MDQKRPEEQPEDTGETTERRWSNDHKTLELRPQDTGDTEVTAGRSWRNNRKTLE